MPDACPDDPPFRTGKASDTLDMLDTAVLRLDNQGRISMMNSAAEQCLQVGRERLMGQPLSRLSLTPEPLRQALAMLPEDGSPLRLHEIDLEGGSFDCTLRKTSDGETLLELHDLSWEQKRTRLQQREVQTGLLELLSRNLGHEIRNPLGGIRGAAQMLAEELDTPELAMLARLVMREADRIDELIQSFGQPEMAQQPVDLYPLLDEVTTLLGAEFPQHVKINRDYDPSIPPFLGDAPAIRQVLLNLMRNACQANATTISLRTRIEHGGLLLQDSTGSALRLDVTDDGEGVPEALRNLLFLPMVTGKRDGTGLGLALSQQIAAAHGGLLSYEPVRAGQGSGSQFSFYLPLGGLPLEIETISDQDDMAP